MSRTRERGKTPNPAKKFISLSGKTGNLEYYNKEKKTTFEFEYPVKFIPLDVLSTIKGYHGSKEKNIYSNEIHNVNIEVFRVKIFDHGELAIGLYADIKDQIKSVGARFANSVYAMMIDENDKPIIDENNRPMIVNFQFSGAALNAFIEFQKGKDIYKLVIIIDHSEPAKKGATNYFIPVFVSEEPLEESTNAADILDIKLQKYLDKYKINQEESVEEIETDDTEEAPLPEDDTQEKPQTEPEEKPAEEKPKEQLQQGNKLTKRSDIIEFGKHKGKTYESLPDDYIIWLLNTQKEDMPINKNAVLEAGSRPSITKLDGKYSLLKVEKETAKKEEKPVEEKIDNSVQIKEAQILMQRMEDSGSMSKASHEIWDKELLEEKDPKIFEKMYFKIITASSICDAFDTKVIDQDTKNKYFRTLKVSIDKLELKALEKITIDCKNLIENNQEQL